MKRQFSTMAGPARNTIRAGHGPLVNARGRSGQDRAAAPVIRAGIAAGYRHMCSALQPRAHDFPHPRRASATIDLFS